jgi:hypothetical protein
MTPAVGFITQIMTRCMFSALNEKLDWNSNLNIYHKQDCIRELMFWKLNISNLKPVFLLEKESTYDIFTDASDVGASGFIKNSHLVMFKTCLKLEAGKSSTWREIKAVELCLLSFKDVLKGSSVTCYTDSQNAANIILKGSKVHEIQCLALTIFEFCAKNDTEIHTVWIPRE